MSRHYSASILLALALLARSQRADAMTSAERRQYLEKLQQILPPVPSFQAWLDKTVELPPDFDLPRMNGLPDPLRFLDGPGADGRWNGGRVALRYGSCSRNTISALFRPSRVKIGAMV
jgi:hypothetical protein